MVCEDVPDRWPRRPAGWCRSLSPPGQWISIACDFTCRRQEGREPAQIVRVVHCPAGDRAAICREGGRDRARVQQAGAWRNMGSTGLPDAPSEPIYPASSGTPSRCGARQSCVGGKRPTGASPVPSSPSGSIADRAAVGETLPSSAAGRTVRRTGGPSGGRTTRRTPFSGHLENGHAPRAGPPGPLPERCCATPCRAVGQGIAQHCPRRGTISTGSPRRPRTSARWPANGSCSSVCPACAASVVDPRRTSVTPALPKTSSRLPLDHPGGGRTRMVAGTGIMATGPGSAGSAPRDRRPRRHAAGARPRRRSRSCWARHSDAGRRQMLLAPASIDDLHRQETRASGTSRLTAGSASGVKRGCANTVEDQGRRSLRGGARPAPPTRPQPPSENRPTAPPRPSTAASPDAPSTAPWCPLPHGGH